MNADYPAVAVHEEGERVEVTPVDAPEPLLAFERAAGAQRLLCVFNLGGEARSVPLEAVAAIPEAPGAAGTFEDGVARVPPWGSLFTESRW